MALTLPISPPPSSPRYQARGYLLSAPPPPVPEFVAHALGLEDEQHDIEQLSYYQERVNEALAKCRPKKIITFPPALKGRKVIVLDLIEVEAEKGDRCNTDSRD